MGVLSLLLLLPVLGAAAIALLPGNDRQLIRKVAISAASVTLIFSWGLIGGFDGANPALQFVEHVPWNVRMGTSYALAIDGISFPMVLLATLLSLIAILASASIKERVKGYYMLMLLLETAMLGVFMAQDWTLFYVFWELTLIPLFFLIDRWGGKNRQTASLNFVLYTMGGSVFMLVSMLMLYDAMPLHNFGMAEMAAAGSALSEHKQVLIFLGFLIGFGVKMPIFPIHGWLPLAHVEAPSPVSILLSGILLKMGSYGLIRAATTLPEAVLSMQGILAGLALFSLIYGGLLAWRQSDMKGMIAYSSISHMGVVLLGIATLNQTGLTGAVMQMVAHGLVAGALFLLIGLLYERTHTRDINDYSSLMRVMPKFAFFTVLAFIGAVGMPGTAGFVAELHAIVGGFARWGWVVVLLSIGVMISAAYAIRTIGRLFTGPVSRKMQGIEDLRTSEMAAAGILSIGILSIGIFPATALDMMSASIIQVSGIFGG
ncbi:MAG: oxidoreductase [gamma proteobacterium symbiont of Ctena orbiculata]|nr:NADH-quinone oxidoreductase subunit M [Candidatus Thiodiazotropha taylori]PVV07831.1 MAG: oxidoreductase [gamma proteobacterium symbiont of Ctena orbiculata]MBT2996187.1 NADH-quinone oxidoreductase subunit M [Candidatus Thiodiazotropha taylori]MBT2999668.1 NADH-quinone oxidoreductase subunit M [Candidatus Thiodiazotropha taylori]MBV2106312.1 NADH-quinone oxidoreductase subunit M [Candidatus Thiodiazotropha taylori]